MGLESVSGQIVQVIDCQENQKWLESKLISCETEAQFREECRKRFGESLADLRVSWAVGGMRLVNLYLSGRTDYLFACVAVSGTKG